MKKILLAAFMGLALLSCNDDKAQEKALLDTVITTHDKLMADDGTIMKNKKTLKAFANSADTSVKDSVAVYTKMLSNADDAMMVWMNKFNPQLSGTHEQVMAYLYQQKQEILVLDKQINVTIAASNQYITKIKTK